MNVARPPLTEQLPAFQQALLGMGHFAHERGFYPYAEDIYDASHRMAQSEVEVAATGSAVAAHISGEALRGMAAAQGQQGTPGKLAEAHKNATSAVEHHAELVDDHPEVRNNLRLDYLILGRVSLQGAISNELRSPDRSPGNRVIDTHTALKAAVDPMDNDAVSPQVLVNALWLKALDTTLFGSNAAAARRDVRRALQVGWQSEAKGAFGSNPNLGLVGRLKAKARALVRPVGVITVAALAGGPERRSTADARRRAALHIAEALFVGPKRAYALSQAEPNQSPAPEATTPN